MTDRGKVYKHLVSGAGSMAAALGGLGALATKLSANKNKLVWSIGMALTHFGSAIEEVARLGGEKLAEANQDALSKHENLRGTLTGFQMQLAQAEADNIFLRSGV
jgi:hypothetical protein